MTQWSHHFIFALVPLTPKALIRICSEYCHLPAKNGLLLKRCKYSATFYIFQFPHNSYINLLCLHLPINDLDYKILKRLLTIPQAFKYIPDLHGVKLAICALLISASSLHTPVDQLYIQCLNKTIGSYCLMSGCEQKQQFIHIIFTR